MKIISLDYVEKQKVTVEGAEGVWKQLPLGSKEGVPVYSYRVFTLEPGGYTPFHCHPFEHMNFIIKGEGILVNQHGEEKRLKAGDFALVEPDEKHQYRNSGSEPFVMICGVQKKFE